MRHLLKTELVRTKTNSVYYAMVSVPFELQEVLGKKRVYKSLSTTSRDQAATALPVVTQEIRGALINLFRILLAEVDPTAELPDGAHICRDVVLTPKTAPYSRKVNLAIERVGFIGAGNRLSTSDAEAIKVCYYADRLIEQSQLAMRRFSRAYWQFCRNIRRIQRDAVFVSPKDGPDSPVVDGRLRNEGRRDLLVDATLSDVMRKFRDENAPKWSNHYRQVYTRQFEVILELLGEKTPIRDLTRADFKDLRDVLDALPPNCNNIAALKNLPIREASARGSGMGLPGLSKATVHKTITVCRSVMGYAEAEGYIERNCVVDLFRRQPPAQIRRVQPFSSDQLVGFFSTGSVYGKAKEDFTRDGRFWVPLIALWSGMRLGEIAQLHAADIEIKSGVPIFVISPEQRVESNEIKSIKTVQSRRIVPVHPELQHMGLLDYHRSILERGFVPLFPDLRRNEYSRQYDQFVQQMAHDMTRSGSRSPNHSFRSFRHNFRDAMREAGTSDENVRRLGGWTLRSIADAYGAGPSERRLYEEVKKINYDGLDLSHLHVQGAEFLE